MITVALAALALLQLLPGLVAMGWRPQGDTTLYQWVNCSLVAAGRVWRQSFGAKTPTKNLGPWNSTIAAQSDGTGWNSKLPTMASAMRSYLVTKYGLKDGVTIPKSFEAATALWGALAGSGYRWDAPFGDLVSYVRAGHAVHTIIDYSVVHNTGLDGSPSFSGQVSPMPRHSIAIAAGGTRLHTWTDAAGVKHSRWELLVHDSVADHRRSGIAQGPHWWPLATVQNGVGRSIGHTGYCEFGFGPDLIP